MYQAAQSMKNKTTIKPHVLDKTARRLDKKTFTRHIGFCSQMLMRLWCIFILTIDVYITISNGALSKLNCVFIKCWICEIEIAVEQKPHLKHCSFVINYVCQFCCLNIRSLSAKLWISVSRRVFIRCRQKASKKLSKHLKHNPILRA